MIDLEQQEINPATENDFPWDALKTDNTKKLQTQKNLISFEWYMVLVLNVLCSRLFLCACRHRFVADCFFFFVAVLLIIFSLLKIHIRILCRRWLVIFLLNFFIGCRSDGISIINSTENTTNKHKKAKPICGMWAKCKNQLHRPHPLHIGWPFLLFLLFIY